MLIERAWLTLSLTKLSKYLLGFIGAPRWVTYVSVLLSAAAVAPSKVLRTSQSVCALIRGIVSMQIIVLLLLIIAACERMHAGSIGFDSTCGRASDVAPGNRDVHIFSRVHAFSCW